MAMRRAYSVKNVLAAKFDCIPADGQYKELFGVPEKSGSWMVAGMPKNGKTSTAMMLGVWLTRWYKVVYNSVEEGLSASIQSAVGRAWERLDPAERAERQRRFVLADKEDVEEMDARLSKRSSADVIIIDSIQFLGLKWSDYKALKTKHHNKLFIWVSHVKGSMPDGSTAMKVMRDSNIYMRVEGFRVFATGRYGGGVPMDVYEEYALAYWGADGSHQVKNEMTKQLY